MLTYYWARCPINKHIIGEKLAKSLILLHNHLDNLVNIISIIGQTGQYRYISVFYPPLILFRWGVNVKVPNTHRRTTPHPFENFFRRML